MSTPTEAQKLLEQMDGLLKQRNPQIQLLEDYYEGVHPMAFATSRFRATFGNLFKEFADNWCELVVNASVERLIINGFRSRAGQGEEDKAAMQIWRDNFLDADYRIAHTEAVKLGHAYILIDPDGNKAFDTESPLVTIEHPSQAIILHDPSNPRRRIAGLKEWVDENGRVCATVYLPDKTYRYQMVEKGSEEERSRLSVSGMPYSTDYTSTPSASGGTRTDWEPRQGVPFETENKLGVVPLIPLRNNPTLAVGGRSDIAVVVPIQNAINKLVSDMIIASEFASFAQRWATGIEIAKDAQTGKPISTEAFLSGAGRIWASEDPEAKFGQFAASDLSNYVKAVEMMIQHLAALTRTPPHYLLGQSGNFPSGDSLTATETGLVAKTKAKQVDFSPSWSEGMYLAKKATGSDADRMIQVVWGDPEQRIRSQRIDGAVKLSVLGVPQDALFEEIGATPEQIDRWHEMKKDMGLDEHSVEFAKREPELEPGEGPEGNLAQEQSASQAARTARINN